MNDLKRFSAILAFVGGLISVLAVALTGGRLMEKLTVVEREVSLLRDMPSKLAVLGQEVLNTKETLERLLLTQRANFRSVPTVEN